MGWSEFILFYLRGTSQVWTEDGRVSPSPVCFIAERDDVASHDTSGSIWAARCPPRPCLALVFASLPSLPPAEPPENMAEGLIHKDLCLLRL
jgi:hypothetical protein